MPVCHRALLTYLIASIPVHMTFQHLRPRNLNQRAIPDDSGSITGRHRGDI